jgi:hypothetical protein
MALCGRGLAVWDRGSAGVHEWAGEFVLARGALKINSNPTSQLLVAKLLPASVTQRRAMQQPAGSENGERQCSMCLREIGK